MSRPMLTYLRITNFAILDDVEIALSPGMTVLTGETGAGKSLIVDAVALLRGGRASADLIRTGADEARVEALFRPAPGSLAERRLRERLVRVGIDPPPDEEGLLVRRVVGRGGRGRVYLGGQLGTVSTLAEVCGDLIDIAGQHEHQTLMDASRHLEILDCCGVDAAHLARMEQSFGQLQQAIGALRAVSLDEQQRAEREEFLRFQLNELEAAALVPGEDVALRQERERLRAAERLQRAARRAEETIYSAEGAVVERLGAVARELGELSALDPRLGELAAQVCQAQAELEDAAHRLRRHADAMTADPARLQEVEDRLHLLSRLLRKHGPDLDAVLRKQAVMRQELEALGAHAERRAQAEAAVARARLEAQQAAEALSRARLEVARRLQEEVTEVLRGLAMPGARLEARLEPRPPREGDEVHLLFTPAAGGPPRRLGPAGWDRCELLLAANPGEEARPLQRIASGGELSRIMLALKRVLGAGDGVATYVFDEIDAGIGGTTADRVGRQIRMLSRSKQVLCITHLAQIAALADEHLLVEKVAEGGRTRTLLRRLKQAERREELARMLGGARVTPRTRAHADELLREAK
ncbi:MAG: DNA repair protein RecN [Myxococcales bacterium]|nr:DNA repair protein RecN [Myxococcales bacterium]